MNQNLEQLARDRIDEQLTACGWIIQNKSSINLHAATGIPVREYATNVGPADYVLFVDKKFVGIIEAKRAEEGVHLTVYEEQFKDYVEIKLNNLNSDLFSFWYKSIGEVIQGIESRLSVADKLEETISNSLQQVKALRQSILKNAFEGELS